MKRPVIYLSLCVGTNNVKMTNNVTFDGDRDRLFGFRLEED